MKLTERQKNILEFIEEFIGFNSYPPTLREIGKRFNISSTFGVKRHIEALVKKGYLTTESHASRTISLVNSNQHKSTPPQNTEEIPLLGRVAAGYPLFSEANIEGFLSIDRSFIRSNEKCFGLKVKGDSMIKAGILEGDHVIVRQQKSAVNGDIVVAMLGDESTLKRFVKNGQKTALKPENENFPVIDVENREDFSIVGKVVGIIRIYN